MNAEEFLKQKLDMKSMPLSLTLKNDNLFALMEEYYEARMDDELKVELMKFNIFLYSTKDFLLSSHSIDAYLQTRKSQTNKK